MWRVLIEVIYWTLACYLAFEPSETAGTTLQQPGNRAGGKGAVWDIPENRNITEEMQNGFKRMLFNVLLCLGSFRHIKVIFKFSITGIKAFFFFFFFECYLRPYYERCFVETSQARWNIKTRQKAGRGSGFPSRHAGHALRYWSLRQHQLPQRDSAACNSWFAHSSLFLK